MNDTNGKEILLQYVTVKVPGKNPKGSKPTTNLGKIQSSKIDLIFLFFLRQN